MKKYLKIFLKLIISSFLLYLLFKRINFLSVFQQISKINFVEFLVALLIFFICWIINSKKWQVLLSYLGFKQPLTFLFKLNLISIFYAAMLPGGQLTGEIIKCYKITKNYSQKGKLISSVLMDRLTGFLAMVLLGLAGILVTNSLVKNYQRILILFLILLLGSFIVFILFNRKIHLFLEEKKLKMGNKNKKIDELTKKFLDLLFVFRGAYGVFLISLFYSLLFQFFNTLGIYFLSLSLHLKIALADILWINGLVAIALFIPLTILGLGIRESGFVYFLGLIDFTNVQALSLSLLISVTYFLTSFIGGIIEFYEAFIKQKS